MLKSRHNMKIIERLNLIDQIGRTLQGRMTFSDIDIYLTAYGIDCKDKSPSANSKWVYVKELLADVSEEIIIQIADELEIDHGYSVISHKEATFWKVGYFKLFLSHLAEFKVQTSKLQKVLKQYGISSFVAHEDIEPSREWQNEIEAGLQTMDAFVAILMPGFKESNWCDQEVGFAVGKGVLIIPVRKKLDPYGFIGKYQGIQSNNKTIGDIADEIFQVIVSSPKTRNKMLTSLSNAISQSTDEKEASEKLCILENITELPIDILERLKEMVIDNKVLMDSKKFIEQINKLFPKYSISRISTADDDVPPWESVLDDDIPF